MTEKIRRYTITGEQYQNGTLIGAKLDPAGDWVRFEDHDRIVSEALAQAASDHEGHINALMEAVNRVDTRVGRT